uniref:Uncharacterized protein n=1 Tax=Rhizophora mucronata TaxID=61149 RepID=A0A2P2MXA7_RHIMU
MQQVEWLEFLFLMHPNPLYCHQVHLLKKKKSERERMKRENKFLCRLLMKC